MLQKARQPRRTFHSTRTPGRLRLLLLLLLLLRGGRVPVRS
ncbi:hypothetical protein [Streptomyces sp. NPDC090021]